mgnify:CR=1 FL=1
MDTKCKGLGEVQFYLVMVVSIIPDGQVHAQYQFEITTPGTDQEYVFILMMWDHASAQHLFKLFDHQVTLPDPCHFRP